MKEYGVCSYTILVIPCTGGCSKNTSAWKFHCGRRSLLILNVLFKLFGTMLKSASVGFGHVSNNLVTSIYCIIHASNAWRLEFVKKFKAVCIVTMDYCFSHSSPIRTRLVHRN